MFWIPTHLSGLQCWGWGCGIWSQGPLHSCEARSEQYTRLSTCSTEACRWVGVMDGWRDELEDRKKRRNGRKIRWKGWRRKTMEKESAQWCKITIVANVCFLQYQPSLAHDVSRGWYWRRASRFICWDKCVNTHASSLCLQLRLAVCVSMTVWVSCHKDWLCATVFVRVCWCMSSTLCLIKPTSHRHSILEVSYSLTPLDAARVTNSILYLFCLPPSPVSLSHSAFV